MLFTRCPGCQTTFRVTADTLRVANGAVRCGTCATVFSAFSGRQPNALKDDLQQDDEMLSPTMQTRELAGLEEFASPELDEAPTAESEAESDAGLADSPIEQPSAESSDIEAQLDAGDGDLDVPIVDTPAVVGPGSTQNTETDAPLEFDDDAASEALVTDKEPEPGAETSASESSDNLQFDVPTDEWAQLLSEIEQSTEDQGSGEDETSENAPVSSDGETETERDADRIWDVGDPAAAESWTEIEMSSDENVGHEQVVVGELDTELDTDEPVGDPQTEAEVSALLEAEADISAEQVDATLSAEPDSELVEALEAGLASQGNENKRFHLWAFSSVALTFALAFQVIHHYRAPLASQSVIGPVVQGAYGVLGVELVPDWNLDQYEILNWVATEAGLGNLRITAQIRNNGPRTQPYPHIHLELKDRWEAVVGSRVFEPVEYLQSDADVDSSMIAGVTVPADFAVVDPGEDAYGFELDVCIQREAGQLSCSSQQVFE